MRPELLLEDCPEELVQRVQEQKMLSRTKWNYSHYTDALLQTTHAGLLYTYLYDGEMLCETEDRTPYCVIVADMGKGTWDTYNVKKERWGKATLDNARGYNSLGAEKRMDEEKFGRTLETMQHEINSAKKARRNRKKKEKIEQEMSKAKELPKGFLSWAEKQLEPFLVYKAGEKHSAYCTRCKKKIMPKKALKCNTERCCPNCGTMCRVKTEKTMPEFTERTVCYIQNTDTGIMARYIKLCRYNPEKRIIWEENLRTVVNRGRKQIWYERRHQQYGDYTWYQNRVEGWVKSQNNPEKTSNYYSMLGGVIQGTEELPVYGGNRATIKRKSLLNYIEDWQQWEKGIVEHVRYHSAVYGFIDLYEKIHRFPQLESLWKLGFTNLAVRKITISVASKEEELHKWLGISKELWRCLLSKTIQERAGITWDFLHRMRKYDNKFADKEEVYRAAALLDEYDMEVFKGLPTRKLVRYLVAIGNKKGIYRDYISIARKLGYNLNDDFVAFPRDIQAAHDEAIEVRDEEKNRKELEAAKKDDKGIAKVHEKIKKIYSYTTEEYLFLPPKTNREIVLEGQTLHHCVGNGFYKNKMLKGDSFIIFLRKKEEPSTPYYTIEISADGEITQAYGKYDKKPDWEIIEPVIEKYKKEVKKRCQKASCRRTKRNVTSAVRTDMPTLTA